MWIVQVALRRPYTFLVMALVILLATPFVLRKMSTDIFPEINIPVISIVWTYAGLSAQEIGQRITAVNERTLTTTVNGYRALGIAVLSGIAVIKIFFQPNANIPTAIAQIVASRTAAIEEVAARCAAAAGHQILRLGNSGHTAGHIQPDADRAGAIRRRIQFSASALGDDSRRRRALSIRRQIAPDLGGSRYLGAARQRAHAERRRQCGQCAKSDTCRPVPSKSQATEYAIALNGSPDTIAGLNRIPVVTKNGATTYLSEVAHVRDGFSPQTNIVRQNGERGVLMSVIKNGGSSTLDIVSNLARSVAGGGADLAEGYGDHAAVRSIRLRQSGHQRRGARGGHCCVPDRDADPGVPGQLAQHLHHCHFDTAIDSVLDHHVVCRRARP